MGWEDRPYYRDRPSSGGNPLMWLVSGSVPLFTFSDIRVRAHASLVVYMALVLLFGFGYGGFTVQDRVVYAVVLFGIVLLHEFGHCFAARWVGGQANDILMHPLGGLAMARPPHRPLPTFITVAGGPAVNVAICLVTAGILWWFTGEVPWNPFQLHPPLAYAISPTWFNLIWYVFWIYSASYQIFMFNLLPIFPLDGGQMLQAILWPKFGYFKSMMFSLTTGMVGAVLAGIWALAFGNIGLAILAMFGFMTCMNMRRQVAAAGPIALEDAVDYSAAYDNTSYRKSGPSARASKKAEKKRAVERDEQVKIDKILEKVSVKGMNSLSWLEKRTLQQATERQRRADAERVRRATR